LPTIGVVSFEIAEDVFQILTTEFEVITFATNPILSGKRFLVFCVFVFCCVIVFSFLQFDNTIARTNKNIKKIISFSFKKTFCSQD